jgi:UDP-N-acetylglucosamine 1-carboxyvinyltransferase
MSSEHAFIIQGSGGKRTLSGEITVSGSKNAVLPALASSILFGSEVTYREEPHIEDVLRMHELLEALGATVVTTDNRTHIVFAQHTETKIPNEIAKRFRASIVLTGPLLASRGAVAFPHPGGCVIGERPIDLFLEGFKALGATVRQTKTQYLVWAGKEGLRGGDVFLKVPSVTGTATLMMAATRAKGTTHIYNAALEPEVVHLAEFLNASGANIIGAGTPEMTIRGSQQKLHGKVVYNTPPDRIEAGSYILLAAIAGKEVTVTNVNPKEIRALLERLEKAGVSLEVGSQSVRITNKTKKHTAVDVKTHEYPGFPTDLQAPMTIFLTQAEGEGHLFETIFEGRLSYVQDLIAMGATIDVWNQRELTVHGPTNIRGRTLKGPDLRAGLAFIIAGAIARGETRVENAYFIDRGYQNIETKLRGIGLEIERITE